jgi:hypothetical protein
MIVVKCEQGTAEWHAARAGCATASRFGDMMAKGQGKTRNAYAIELAVERLNGRAFDSGFQSFAMARGLEREPQAKAAYESMTGEFIQSVGFIRHDDMLAGASPDGLLGPGLLEVKCPNVGTHIGWLSLDGSGECPGDYFWQVHGQMWIAQAQWVDFVSFCPDIDHPRLRLIVSRVKRDAAVIEQLQSAVPLFLDQVDRQHRALLAHIG